MLRRKNFKGTLNGKVYADEQVYIRALNEAIQNGEAIDAKVEAEEHTYSKSASAEFTKDDLENLLASLVMIPESYRAIPFAAVLADLEQISLNADPERAKCILDLSRELRKEIADEIAAREKSLESRCNASLARQAEIEQLTKRILEIEEEIRKSEIELSESGDESVTDLLWKESCLSNIEDIMKSVIDDNESEDNLVRSQIGKIADDIIGKLAKDEEEAAAMKSSVMSVFNL